MHFFLYGRLIKEHQQKDLDVKKINNCNAVHCRNKESFKRFSLRFSLLSFRNI